MKVLKKQILQLFLGMAFLVTACQKEDIPVYTAEERINFDYDAMDIQVEKGVFYDTLSFDLGFSDQPYATVNLEFILIGYAKDYEREVKLVISGDTACVGKVLEIPEKVMLSKGQVKMTVPCRILIEDSLKKKDRVFFLKLEDSEDLLAGNRTTMCLKASADVPSVWKGDEAWWGNKVAQFFGECSKEKYRFVYSVLHVWNFSTWNGSGFSSSMGDANKFNPAKKLLKQELEKHGPIYDPDKGLVTFPD